MFYSFGHPKLVDDDALFGLPDDAAANGKVAHHRVGTTPG